MIGLRAHQEMLYSECNRSVLLTGQRLKIFSWVVPGGGKSWLPGIIHRRWPQFKIAWFAPRVTLRLQAAESLKGQGIEVWESENDIDPSRGTAGFVASHAGLTACPELYIQELERNDYILVIDEVHHAKRFRDGTCNQLASVIPKLRCRIELLMTGTLETNDDSFIYGVEYEEIPSGWKANPLGSSDIYIRYNRETALKEKAIVPIEFYHHDGPVEFIGADGKKNVQLSLASRKERSAAVFTALRTDLAIQLLELGLSHWRQHGDQLIIVCDRQRTAEQYHKMLADRGIDAALAISDEGDDAKVAVKRFRRGEVKVMVTCAMCYEGLDAPKVSHIICLTHIRSVPWIEQMLARCWRWVQGKRRCYAFVPDDPDMNEVIERIRLEEPANVEALGKNGGGGGGGGPSVVAISSEVDATRIAFLDGETAVIDAKAKAVEALGVLGLGADHPLFAEMVEAQISAQAEGLPKSNGLTVSERATQIRKSTADLCRRADWARFQDKTKFGTTQKELYQRVGIIFETATLSELERVAQHATTYCEKFLAR